MRPVDWAMCKGRNGRCGASSRTAGGSCLRRFAASSSAAAPSTSLRCLVFAYFAEGAPPPFPPYPAPQAEGLIENQTQFVPCNWLQCFQNSMGTAQVAFVHRDE